jgi:zinc transport system permease protein
MNEFFAALFDPAVPFIRYALLAGALSSAAFGIVGTYVTVKRISYIAGAIAHSVLAGIGLSLYLQAAYGLSWFTPILGASLAALVSAAAIGLVSMYARQREDTVIGSIWAVGMAVGILFIARTPGYVDAMSYLFGNILVVSREDLFLIAGLDLVVVTAGVLLYDQLVAVSFDAEFARVRGVRVPVYYMALLLLTALTVVLLTTIVGIIMVIALLTIPPAVAGLFSGTMRRMMALATAFTLAFTVSGMGLSYVTDLPSGATIIVLAGSVYLLATGVRGAVRRIGRRSRISSLENGGAETGPGGVRTAGGGSR